ncbi:MAG: hypothetical protein M1828_006337 [Chrysothrix sp. TS-e1954]|nr:MAG: hypothetical protein M1828_006337 [Chrysothrix sp. TS-e1954]
MIDPITPTTSKDADYIFTRSHRDSGRLHMQHWILKEHLGYLLHPCIPRDAADYHVADIGTGNACWLLDLASSVPTSWTLSGFDLSSQQFPHAVNIPGNVTLGTFDALGSVPQDLRGKFDIVHIRAFAAIVKGGDPGPLLRNLISMLKPRGYLQWDEVDPNNFTAHAPTPEVSKIHADRIIEVYLKCASRLSILLPWMAPGAMAQIFRKHDLEVVNDITRDRWTSPSDLKPVLRKAYTDNWMMALEETVLNMMGKGSQATADLSVEDFGKIFDGTAKETSEGVELWIDIQVVVGRKAD